MREQGYVDLVHLAGLYGNSVVVRVSGRDTKGDPRVLVGEIAVDTKFVKGTLPTWIFPEDLAAWRAVLDQLAQAGNASWRKGQKAAELHIEVVDRDEGEDRVRVSVVDRSMSQTTAQVLLDLADGWIDEQRSRLDEVQKAWPDQDE
ncbi:DUF5959 family protein [Streptomyces sp. NPDC056470]|uniref:DUF5959 family protein n=1 Tax=unclassified Streptomyces TaxID=2593676 RepID=UPI0036C41D9F